METLVQKFLEENEGKQKVILLGEDHGGSYDIAELFENVGKQLTVVRKLHTIGKPFVIYHEMPFDLFERLTNKFTAYYLRNEAHRMNIPFKTSRITYECRAEKGSCDDLYATNILSHTSEITVAVLGLLHAADMVFSDDISVLRINCCSQAKTNFALRETRRYGRSNTATSIETKLPYINDSNAVQIGKEIVIEEYLPAFEKRSAEASTKNNKSLGSFKPIWIKNSYGNWVAKCPICGNISGTAIQYLTHKRDCPNKGKSVDVSEKPTAGGKRKTKKNRRLRKKRYTIR